MKVHKRSINYGDGPVTINFWPNTYEGIKEQKTNEQKIQAIYSQTLIFNSLLRIFTFRVLCNKLVA